MRKSETLRLKQKCELKTLTLALRRFYNVSFPSNQLKKLLVAQVGNLFEDWSKTNTQQQSILPSWFGPGA